jgi:hypothetical protein
MATVTVVTDTDAIYPFSTVRGSDVIPYVLGVDASDNLVLYTGNAANPTSFSSDTVVAAANWVKGTSNAYMVIGEYSSTEYIHVFYKDNGNDLRVARTPTSSISFSDPAGGDIIVNMANGITAHYDTTNERIVVGFLPDSKAMSIVVTEDNGANFTSEIEIFDGTRYMRGQGVVWDGSYIHCVVGQGSNREHESKRYNFSSSTLEYWTGSTWSTCTDTDTGYAGGSNYLGGALTASIGTNLMAFSGGVYGSHSGSVLSRSSTLGESFSSFPNQGYQGAMGKGSSHMIKTEAGEVDDIQHFAAYQYSNSFEDAYYQIYDYSVPSWGSPTVLEDYGTGSLPDYFEGEGIQVDGWSAVSFQLYDGSTNYYIYYRHFETGTGGATPTAIQPFVDDGTIQVNTDDGTIQKTVD